MQCPIYVFGFFLNWNLDALRYIAFYGHSSIKLRVSLIVVVCTDVS